MSNITRATLALGAEGVPFQLHPYDYAPGGEKVGRQAAQSLGLDPARVFKTLMVKAGKLSVCAVIPSDREVSMKALAALVGAKSAEMMKPRDAERVTGYVIGGVSPFGQRQPSTIIVDEAAFGHEEFYLNAGQRGLLMSLSAADAVRLLGAIVGAISA
jgi:Cys-tRNA(Pro)/Cys-tRNA(Cys) deacylase